MSRRCPRPPTGPPRPRPTSDRAERILAAAGIEDSTAATIASAYRAVRDSQSTWAELLAIRDALTQVERDLPVFGESADIPELARAVDAMRRLLEAAPVPATAPSVAKPITTLLDHLRALRAELGRGPLDETRWWPPPPNYPPLADALMDAMCAITGALHWQRAARRIRSVVEPRVKVILRCRISYDLCCDDSCDHPRCGRPGDVVEVSLSDAKDLCAPVFCVVCEGTGASTSTPAGAGGNPVCERCHGTGTVPRGAVPFDEDSRQAISQFADPPIGRPGNSTEVASQAALRLAERQHNLSRTQPRHNALDDADRRIHCPPDDLPRVVAAILHRAGLGSEDGRARSLEALTKRMTKVYKQQILAPRSVAEANALRVVSRRTQSDPGSAG